MHINNPSITSSKAFWKAMAYLTLDNRLRRWHKAHNEWNMGDANPLVTIARPNVANDTIT